LATTEPLTGARIPTDSDSPLGGTAIARAIQDIADETLPRFATTAARDTAYSNWIAAGHNMAAGLHCVVNGRLFRFGLNATWIAQSGYQGSGTSFIPGAVEGDTFYHQTFRCAFMYSSGSWRQADIATVTSTSDLTSYVSALNSAGLTMGNGFQVFQNDNNTLYVGTGGNGLRLASSQDWSNGSIDTGNNAVGANWQAYQSYVWDTPLGAKVTIPADGVTRTLLLDATANIAGDGWMRIRADVGPGAGTATVWPNTLGKRAISSANAEIGISMKGRLKLDGTQQAVVYLEAKSQVAGSMNMIVPQLSILAV
jgi:hypothetical protein